VDTAEFVTSLLDAPDWFDVAAEMHRHPDLVTEATAGFLTELAERLEVGSPVAHRVSELAGLLALGAERGVKKGFVAFLRRRDSYHTLWNDLLRRALSLSELDQLVVEHPELLDPAAMPVAHEIIQTMPDFDESVVVRRLGEYAGWFALARARGGRIR